MTNHQRTEIERVLRSLADLARAVMTAETRRDEILRMLRILHGISDGLTVMGRCVSAVRDEINGIADALATMVNEPTENEEIGVRE
jgi:hypothetical protein